jgi:hypothetical protein
MSTDYYPPTQGTDLQSAHPNNQNWLPIELERELEAAAPGPNDIDENGFVVNLDRLEEVATKLFPRGRLFYNWYQAKDFHNKLGSMWGYVGSTDYVPFDVSITGNLHVEYHLVVRPNDLVCLCPRQTCGSFR